jgi:hypothetical protein
VVIPAGGRWGWLAAAGLASTEEIPVKSIGERMSKSITALRKPALTDEKVGVQSPWPPPRVSSQQPSMTAHHPPVSARFWLGSTYFAPVLLVTQFVPPPRDTRPLHALRAQVREMADAAARQGSSRPGMEVLKQGFLEKKGGSTVRALLLERRARIALGTATQCARINDAPPSCPPLCFWGALL